MREVHLVANESTATSLVFRAADSDEEFFLAVDDSLLEILTSPDDVFHQTLSAPRVVEHEEPVELPVATTELESSEKQQNVVEMADTPQETPNLPQNLPERLPGITPEEDVDKDTHSKQPDPQLSAPLTMRPREIQDRIRSGASLTELAAEIGVPVSRIEPFAHPVLADRASIAQQAKQANPVRDDGPAKLTLWEVLATAFAARGLDLTTTEWDAYRDPAHQWVVRVTWQSGISHNSAEWTFHRKNGTLTVVARNANAADLIDPSFAQPVRSLSRVPTTPSVEDTRDDLPVITDDDDGPDDTGPVHRPAHPAPTPSPSRRRRKAVTPGWEDILLGVRPSTKRSPKRDES